MELAAAAVAVSACVVGYHSLHKWLIRRIAHIYTGELRRIRIPPGTLISQGAKTVAESSDVDLQTEMLRLEDGTQIYCYVLKPKHMTPTHAVVFLHGYSSTADLYVENVAEWVRAGAVVVAPDLPSHGRSDGTLAYVSDWWAFVGKIWVITELLVSKHMVIDGKSLPLFLAGNSLGGGISACMVLQRPTYFRGVVLIAPMLTVSDDVKPPWIVQMICKHFVARLLPTWPITPAKDLMDFDFRIPAHGQVYVKVNPFSMHGTQAFLATARECGFNCPDYLEEHLHEVRTPFLVQHGKADKITDPAVSERFWKEAAATDKTLKLYDGVYHCELICCTPGGTALTGIEWLPEQVEATETCMRDSTAWMAARI